MSSSLYCPGFCPLGRRRCKIHGKDRRTTHIIKIAQKKVEENNGLFL